MSEPTATPAKPGKVTFVRAVAIGVARELCEALKPHCERLIVAGSLRRGKAQVKDVEILYIPKRGLGRDGELFERPVNHADAAIQDLLRRFVLRKRLTVKAAETYGEKNKLLLHVLSGVPVDLFEATPENWFNYLVCRTGPTRSNTLIAQCAQESGYKWNPYGCGFTRLSDGEQIPMGSEEAVFRFVGLPYRVPEKRT